MEGLPRELLCMALSFLQDDDRSLLSCELVCKKWRATIMTGRANFYRTKCEGMLAKTPNLQSTFKQHKFAEHCGDARWAKAFYFKLKSLPDRWRSSKPKPAVKVIDCMTAVDPRGKKASDEFTDDWKRKHNYRGVYDSVWDPSVDLLTCSVNDTIQVWAVDSGECLAVLGPSLLDKGVQASCFDTSGHTLASGTYAGSVKLLDLLSGKELKELPTDGKHFISDVKLVSNDLIAINCYGEITEWRLREGVGSAEADFVRNFAPSFEALDGSADMRERYSARNFERLIDFNDQFVATNGPGFLCCFARDGSSQYDIVVDINAGMGQVQSAPVLCLRIASRNDVYWGEMGGRVGRMAVRPNAPVRHLSTSSASESAQLRLFVTRFEDNVTSLAVRDDVVIVGDVNAEIHCLDRKQLEKEDSEGKKKQKTNPNYDPLRFVLEDGHQYKEYIWTVNADAARVFSGDSLGKLVIHDLWDYREVTFSDIGLDL